MKVVFFWALTVIGSTTLGFYLSGADYRQRHCSVKDRVYEACMDTPNANENACLHLLKPDR